MTTAGWTALTISVLGALCYAAASILQAVGARRSVGTVRTMGHPLYLLGIGFDMLAWVGAMIALRELAVYVVESILAASLALTVLGARLFLKSRLRKRDAAAITVTMGALAVLACSAGPQEAVETSDTLRWALCAAAACIVLTGWAAAKAGVPGGGIAALAGLSLGGAALIGRSLPVPDGLDALGTTMAVLTEPLTLALLTFAVTGMTLYAHALQHGEVGPVTAVHWAFEVMAPSAVAIVFLGDTVRPGWGPAAIAAAAVTVAAACLLATAPATHATAHPVDPSQTAPLPRPTLPAVPSIAALAPDPSALRDDRVIWWGPPPIWTPPRRPATAARPALAALPGSAALRALPAAAMPALTWEPSSRVRETWADPHLPATEAATAAEPRTWTVGSAVFSRVWVDEPEPVRHGPWDEI